MLCLILLPCSLEGLQPSAANEHGIISHPLANESQNLPCLGRRSKVIPSSQGVRGFGGSQIFFVYVNVESQGTLFSFRVCFHFQGTGGSNLVW